MSKTSKTEGQKSSAQELSTNADLEKDGRVKKTIPFYEPEVHVRSKAWNDYYTKEDFNSAENLYGKLAASIQQLAQRINDLIKKFTDILIFSAKTDLRDELWYVPKLSEVSNILIFLDKDDERGEFWYVPTQLVDSVMNVYFSALKIRRELELLLTEQEAKLFFNRLRKNLALTDSSYADEKIGSVYAWYGKQEAEALVKQLERMIALQTLTLQDKNHLGQQDEDRQDENWHNDDFSEVRWNGQTYKFDKPQQALSVEYLWKNKRAREKSIGEAIGSEADNFRLIHIFRQSSKKAKMHPAWGTMIVPDGKGIYALAEYKKASKK